MDIPNHLSSFEEPKVSVLIADATKFRHAVQVNYRLRVLYTIEQKPKRAMIGWKDPEICHALIPNLQGHLRLPIHDDLRR
jgi:hypothetical protein